VRCPSSSSARETRLDDLTFISVQKSMIKWSTSQRASIQIRSWLYRKAITDRCQRLDPHLHIFCYRRCTRLTFTHELFSIAQTLRLRATVTATAGSSSRVEDFFALLGRGSLNAVDIAHSCRKVLRRLTLTRYCQVQSLQGLHQVSSHSNISVPR